MGWCCRGPSDRRKHRPQAVSTNEVHPTDGTHSQETHHHLQGANDEGRPATGSLDHVQTAEGADDVDGAENHLGEVSVAKTGGLEDGGAKFAPVSCWPL